MAVIEAAERHVEIQLHDDGDDMLLAGAHEDLEMVALAGEDLRLDDLRRIDVGIRGEVFHEAFEVGGGGSGGEGGSAPVMQHGAGQVGAAGRGDRLDDLFAAVEAWLIGGYKEAGGGAMLLIEAALDLGDVAVESGDGRGLGLGEDGLHRGDPYGEQEHGRNEEGRRKGCGAAVHELHLAPGRRGNQCKACRLVSNVPHRPNDCRHSGSRKFSNGSSRGVEYTGRLGKMTDQGRGARYRFGVFEADAATGELRRQGLRVKLNGQPFQVLLMLLERPGELLGREEIARRLWPDGTFVDAAHGVNSAVNRIREALGDTAARPRFVETLARRGYRFVAPVEQVFPGEPQNPQAESPDLVLETEATETSGEGLTPLLASPDDLPRTRGSVVSTLFILLQLMYAGFYVGALANLTEIEDLFSPLPKPAVVLDVVMVTAAILIPVRAFLLSAWIFRAPKLREKFLRIWPTLLIVDELWALSPFLLLHHINFGLALSCAVLLVYSPFAQRSLVLMGTGSAERRPSAAHR